MEQSRTMSGEASTQRFPCPNPRCTASVAADQSFCSLCSHSLAACPVCGKLMDITIGMCAGCGYRPVEAQPAPRAVGPGARPAAEAAQRPAGPAPVVIRFKPERREVSQTMADAYRRAALAEADMMVATRVLERARAWFLTETNAFTIWELLDTEIGAADSATLRPALVFLRSWFEGTLFSQQKERLRESFTGSPDMARRDWLTAYSEGLARWRLLLCQALLDVPRDRPEQSDQKFDFKSSTRLAQHERWTELHPFFKYLAEQEFLPPATRARLFIALGQIHLYHFRFLDRALACFRQSEALAPEESVVLSAMGSYQLENKDPLAARTYFERAIQVGPGRPDGYLGMGDLAVKEDKFEEARGWFQNSIGKAGFDSLGYTRLIRLYGRPEYFERYESNIPSLAERAVAVDETAEYAVDIEIGDAYSAGKRYADARNWYQKAIALDPNRCGGYVSLGQSYFDEGAEQYPAAEEAFKKAVEVAPEFYLGYWQLGLLYEQRREWEIAEKYYADVVQRQPEFRPHALAKIGDMQLNLGKRDLAETTLFEALRLDATSDAGTLSKLAEEYDKAGQTSEALRVHRQVREIKGPSYEATYRNRLGNFFYAKQEYALAIEHYSLAIKANDKGAIYYSNLVEALRKCRDWNRIRKLREQMPAAIREEKGFRTSISSARNQEANEHYERGEYAAAIQLYGEAIVLDPEDPILYSNLAGAWERNPEEGIGRFDRGIQALQDASRLDPGNADYSRRIERLKTLKRLLPGYGTKAYERHPGVTPIAVEVASNLVPLVNAGETNLSPELLKLIDGMRTAISQRYGLRVPGVRFRGNDGYPAGLYVIFLMDTPIVSDSITLNRRFSPTPPAELFATGLQAEQAQAPISGLKGSWLQESDVGRATAAGLDLWSVLQYPMYHLQALLERNLPALMGAQETHSLISEQCPDLLNAILQYPGGVSALARVLRALLEEQVSIAAFRKIVEHYLMLCRAGTGPVEIVESIRGLGGSAEVLRGSESTARLLSTAARFTELVEKGIQSSSGIPVLALEPEVCQQMLAAVRASMAAHSPTALLVEDRRLRPFVRELVKVEFPDLAVLSRSELSPTAPSPIGAVEVES